MQIHRIVSWSTKKVGNKFEYTVYSFDEGTDTIIHAKNSETTRPKAVARAKQWVRYLKAQQKKVA